MRDVCMQSHLVGLVDTECVLLYLYNNSATAAAFLASNFDLDAYSSINTKYCSINSNLKE